MIIDSMQEFTQPRHLHRTAFGAVQVRGVMNVQVSYVIPTGFGDFTSSSTILSSLRDY